MKNLLVHALGQQSSLVYGVFNPKQISIVELVVEGHQHECEWLFRDTNNIGHSNQTFRLGAVHAIAALMVHGLSLVTSRCRALRAIPRCAQLLAFSSHTFTAPAS
jgi:hypothetical protein